MMDPEKPAAPARPAPRTPSAVARLYAALVSPKLAIALLIGVLACCLVGVTVVRGARAGELIFATLWFNALLVLLALSSAAAFFSRIWRRRLTVVSLGMILFHLSFAAMLGGIVFNSLFHFEGILRITEGETLPNGQEESYDRVDRGRLFDFSRLRGETTLVRMHRNYMVGGVNKEAAYEISVRDGDQRSRSIIYITEYFDFEGLRYFCLKEGYSVMIGMADPIRRVTVLRDVPLQSYRQADGKFLYAAGTPERAVSFLFPQPPEQPLAELQVSYVPSFEERKGQVSLVVQLLGPDGRTPGEEQKAMLPVGGNFKAGRFLVSPREIHYWVGMNVRYDPGLTTILGSLCFGMLGMGLTLYGRLRQGSPRKRAG